MFFWTLFPRGANSFVNKKYNDGCCIIGMLLIELNRYDLCWELMTQLNIWYQINHMLPYSKPCGPLIFRKGIQVKIYYSDIHLLLDHSNKVSLNWFGNSYVINTEIFCQVRSIEVYQQHHMSRRLPPCVKLLFQAKQMQSHWEWYLCFNTGLSSKRNFIAHDPLSLTVAPIFWLC